MRPLILRPRAALLMAVVLSAVLVAAAALGWYALPAHIRVLFTGLQVGTLVFFILVMIGFMMAVGLSRVRVDEDGLAIRNGLRNHRIPWTAIRGFRFTEHDPWAYVLLEGEPDQRPLMAVQRTDHERAEQMVSRLRDLLGARR